MRIRDSQVYVFYTSEISETKEIRVEYYCNHLLAAVYMRHKAKERNLPLYCVGVFPCLEEKKSYYCLK